MLLSKKSVFTHSIILQRRKNEPLVDGYYIKWRAVPTTSGQKQSGVVSTDSHWVNISQPTTETYIINGLRPFKNYEFFVIPYHKTIQGMPSNSLNGATSEAREFFSFLFIV